MRYAIMLLGMYLVLHGDLNIGNGKVKDMIEQLCKQRSAYNQRG